MYMTCIGDFLRLMCERNGRGGGGSGGVKKNHDRKREKMWKKNFYRKTFAHYVENGIRALSTREILYKCLHCRRRLNVSASPCRICNIYYL